MKKIWVRVLIILLAVVCLLMIGGYLGRKEIVKSYYGELESFDYYSGGGIAGYYERYVITREGEDYVLMARVFGTEMLEVKCPIDPSVAEEIRNIIISENLLLRNGVDEVEENLYDGLGETLNAEFAGGALTYNYYGTSVYRNNTLADYLLNLTKESIGIYGPGITESTPEQTGSSVA